MFFSLMIFVFSYGQYYKGIFLETMTHLLFLQKYVGKFVCG